MIKMLFAEKVSFLYAAFLDNYTIAVDYGQSDRDAKYYKMAECHKLVKIHQLGQMFLAKA